MRLKNVLGLTVCVALAVQGTATLARAPYADAQPTGAGTNSATIERFSPTSDPKKHQIDYAVWDDVLSHIVFRMGKSLREGAGRPDPKLGSRREYGHDSRYRLEGNRVLFSFFDENVKDTFSLYRKDLESTAATVDIAKLSRNEQLAFWINLHNVALVEQIARSWPVRQPSTIKLDGVPLDEARFITVQGVQMSPKDIRTKIVYPNWRDPKVIYGFWRGDIGGPSLQGDAFTAKNVGRLLTRGAREFVNSLRGTQKSGDRLQVSTIFEEARTFYFPNWPDDLRGHIAQYADADVEKILRKTSLTETRIYEADIADMAGGAREPTYSATTSGDRVNSFRVPSGMARLLREQQRKVTKIIREGRTGRVYFVDINLPGQEAEEVK